MKRIAHPALGRQTLVWLGLMVAAAGLLTWRLASLVPGLSQSELALPTVRTSLQTVWNQPLALPITISRLIVAVLLPNTGLAASRLTAAILGLLLAASGYWLLRRWYGSRMAFFGAILLISAPWYLHVSRLASPVVVFPLAMMAGLCLAARWHDAQRPGWLLPASTAVLAILVYVPGFIWLLVTLIVVERRNIAATVRTYKHQAITAAVIKLLILVPLIHSLIRTPQSYKPLLGLPEHWPTVQAFGKQFLAVWQHVFIGGYHQPEYNVGGLPMVNILVTLAFITGIVLYARHPKASRSRLLGSLWLVDTLLIALGGPVHITLLLPIVLVLAVGGVGYLLHLWLQVFPRNPLARGLGIGLIGLLIAFAAIYNLRNYFVAWPLSPVTQAAFQRKL